MALDLKKFDDLFGNISPKPHENANANENEAFQQTRKAVEAQWGEADSIADLYRQYQANILTSSSGTTDIIKGSANGESVYNLLFTALKVIGAMTNDGGILEATVKKNLDNVAKTAVQDAEKAGTSFILEPQRAELAAAKERLRRLKEAIKTKSGDDKLRVANAIKEHEAEIEKLEKEIGKEA